MVEPPAAIDSELSYGRTAIIVLAAMFAIAIGSGLFGPYGVALAAVGMVMTPLALLAVLAQVAVDRPWARWFAVALMTTMAMLVVWILVQQSGQLLEWRHGADAAEAKSGLWFIAGTSALGLILALTLLAPTVRRRLARYVPIDPDNFAHALAMALVATLIVSAFAPLIVLGEPVTTALAAAEPAREADTAGKHRAALYEQVYQLLWLLPVCALAVGYGVRRGFRATLARLGLVRPSGKQLLAAVGIALPLVFVALLLGTGVHHLWDALGWTRTDQSAVRQLMGYMLTPIGALVVGVCAGLGEELLVRGVLQPRLGLVLSNLVFTAMHAGQYGWDLLLVIFFVGAVFGVVRKYSSTTVSVLVHGLYDAVLILMTMNAAGLNEA